jgi:antitoxin HicB
MSERDLMRYLKLPFRLNVTYDQESAAWIARYPELPGCVADGPTPEEALIEAEAAKTLWIETAVAEGQQIPQPQGEPTYSGKFVLRLPKSLHEAAAERADREGISLNSYLVHLVSDGVRGLGVKVRSARTRPRTKARHLQKA